jgi:hypothetical protein
MHPWIWLNANAGALQSIAASVATVLTVITIGVLIVTWKAIKVQADAARALTQTAERQNRLLADQIELSTAPLLVFEPCEGPAGKDWKVVNRGHGVAFQVQCWQGGFEHFHPRPGTGYACKVLNPSTIRPGLFAYVEIDPLWKTVTVKYRGIDDQARATKMNQDDQGNQHYIIRRGGKEITLDDFPRPNGEKAVGDWTK